MSTWYWRDAPERESLYECYSKVVCLGEAAPYEDPGCLEGTEGPLCSVCAAGYVRSQDGWQCTRCGDGDYTSGIGLIMMVSVAFMTVLLFLYWPWIQHNRKVIVHRKADGSGAAAARAVAELEVQAEADAEAGATALNMRRLTILPSRKTEAVRAMFIRNFDWMYHLPLEILHVGEAQQYIKSAMRALANQGFPEYILGKEIAEPLISFSQVLSSFIMMRVEWPKSLVNVFSHLNIDGYLALDFTGLYCELSPDFYHRYYIIITMIISIVSFFGILALSSKRCIRDPRDLKVFHMVTLKAVILVLFFCYPFFCSKLLLAFPCRVLQGMFGSGLLQGPLYYVETGWVEWGTRRLRPSSPRNAPSQHNAPALLCVANPSTEQQPGFSKLYEITYLMHDFNEECFTAAHVRLLGIGGVVGLVGFVLGVPLFFYYCMVHFKIPEIVRSKRRNMRAANLLLYFAAQDVLSAPQTLGRDLLDDHMVDALHRFLVAGKELALGERLATAKRCIDERRVGDEGGEDGGGDEANEVRTERLYVCKQWLKVAYEPRPLMSVCESDPKGGGRDSELALLDDPRDSAGRPSKRLDQEVKVAELLEFAKGPEMAEVRHFRLKWEMHHKMRSVELTEAQTWERDAIVHIGFLFAANKPQVSKVPFPRGVMVFEGVPFPE
ncbi:hypothetical protein CYMTET_32609, partial [Cymbomonas tetramitiformis]